MAKSDPQAEVAKELLESIFGKSNPKFDDQFAELLAKIEKRDAGLKFPASNEAPVEMSANAPGYGLPPLYSNRFHLWANDNIIRFLIGDSITGPDLQYKVHFVMTRADARDFIKIATDLLNQTEPELK